MSENNIEQKETAEEQITSEEAVEVSVNEEVVETEAKDSFAKRLGAVIVDQAVIGVISVALLFIFDAILKAAGYAVAQKGSMLLIFFIATSILYTSIVETAKSGKTIGKQMMGL
ncbi:RDD family protein [Clostridium swellfunianum]|uniref:RDD family protein n=1 Tax=Clostridium swellfunianum TaxID=1367462 RepID=UPI00202E00E3|nr:RDD family protein [Clostridium swellfunianum]MCM0648849.1 RDD family protein [Clostridium swellfunianum]